MFKQIKSFLEENSVKLVMVCILCVLLFYQIKLVEFVLLNYQDLKLDAFSYGARKFNINEATCYIDEKTILYFNQSGSKFIITNHGTG